MKCPKCGYVSFAGLPKCKKCGHAFPAASGSPEPSLFNSPLPSASASPVRAENRLEAGWEPIDPVVSEASPHEAETASSQPDAWQEELSKRVEGYRRRRSHGPDKSSDSGTLDLDFDAHEIGREAPGAKVIDFPLSTPPPPPPAIPERIRTEAAPNDDPLNLGEVHLRHELTSPPPAELTLSPRDEEAAPIVVESPSPEEAAGPAPELGDAADLVARVGPRFTAGMLDALVLLAGAGVFTLIFWRTGGRLSPQGLDLVVVTFMTCLFILLYFGVLIALTSSTPGLTWMGLEIRRHNGQEPSVRDAFWRAAGCLISAGALMLGFLWALLDSDGLTWHDRMSGTFITPSRRWHSAGQAYGQHL